MTFAFVAALVAALAAAAPSGLGDPSDPVPVEARAAVAAAAGDAAGVAAALDRLAQRDPARAAAVRAAFARFERNRAPAAAADAPPADVIAVFGSALDAEGRATPTLALRLSAAEAAARAAPGARLILSGGVPRSGRTEADVMAGHLLAQVDRGRLVLEDQSRDTVGNALYVARLVCDAASAARPGRVALVTSASHMPRARTLLELALAARGCPGDVQPLPAADAPSELSAEASRAASERQAAYRDVVRVLDAGRPSRN